MENLWFINLLQYVPLPYLHCIKLNYYYYIWLLQTDWLMYHYFSYSISLFHFFLSSISFVFDVTFLYTFYIMDNVQLQLKSIFLTSSPNHLHASWMAHSSFCHVTRKIQNQKKKKFSRLSLDICNGLYAFNSLISLLHLNEPSIWPFGVLNFFLRHINFLMLFVIRLLLDHSTSH